MKPKPISVDEVIEFAAENEGITYTTLKYDRPFTIKPSRTGVTFDLPLPATSYFPVNRTSIAKYLAVHRTLSYEDRLRPKNYPEKWHERSYMVRTLAEIEASGDYRERQKDDEGIAKTPPTTRKALYLARIGQGQFRDDLIASQSGCSVTGIRDARFLRAAHIKPWRTSTDTERLDKHNGLLLSPVYDHLFDRYLITFADEGHLVISKQIPALIRKQFGISDAAKSTVLGDKARTYLAHPPRGISAARERIKVATQVRPTTLTGWAKTNREPASLTPQTMVRRYQCRR